MRTIFIISFATLAWGCGQVPQHTEKPQDTLTSSKPATKPDTFLNKADTSGYKYANNPLDSLISDYLRHSKSKLVRLAIESKIPEEWYFDQIVHRDSIQYYRFQIGHDVTDENGTNLRFVTDQWIYIDSLTQQLYEYDIANDTLMRWTK